MDTGTLNYRWSQFLIAGLVAAGVRHAILSPGSRSTPLTLAALRQPNLTCRTIIDERSAAFFALGIAKATQKPVIVIATSGSAPANWYPAIIEASQAGHPLLFISADRPPELIGCGANQTIDQLSLFGEHVRARYALPPPFGEFDPSYLNQLANKAVEQACWPFPGPVHLNAPFREPLVPQTPLPAPACKPIHNRPPRLSADASTVADWCAAIGQYPGVIVCGEMPAQAGLAEALNQLAHRLGSPILAEPLSNLRHGGLDTNRLCIHYNTWLTQTEAAERFQPHWVLRFGAYPLSRPLQAYIARAGIQMLVEPYPRWSDPQYLATHILRTDALEACTALLEYLPEHRPDDWGQALLSLDAASTVTAPWPIAELFAILPEQSKVFLGNSLTVRQIDTHSGKSSKHLRFFGNRGVSGIDGNISTALGIAASQGNVIALLGDLTSLHDLGGLAAAQGLNAIIVILNNQGGGIFDYLPQAALPEFIEGWRTPQQIDFKHIANAFKLGYAAANKAEGLISAVQEALIKSGPQLIEYKMLASPSKQDR